LRNAVAVCTTVINITSCSSFPSFATKARAKTCSGEINIINKHLKKLLQVTVLPITLIK
jgi:hypothetical protein